MIQADGAPAAVGPCGPGSKFFRACAVIGFIGVLTTAGNIFIGQLLPATDSDPLRAAALSQNVLYMTLQWILLAHALATLVPPVALASVRFPALVGLAGLGALFTVLEKFTELVGQTARVFVLNGAWRTQLLTTTDPYTHEKLVQYQEHFATVWDSMYFVLWICGSLAATCFAVAFWHGSSAVERWLARTAGVVAALGALMTLSDYFGQQWAAATHPAVYFVVMTAYRGLIAWTLWSWGATLANEESRASR